MALVGAAVAAVGVGLGYSAMRSQKKAASEQAQAVRESEQASIDEQRRQFNQMVSLLSPYVTAGKEAIDPQKDLLGLSGEEKQKEALSSLENSPFFKGLFQQGENAILQNAGATGGLRGGNVQSALAQFRPQMFADVIQQRLANLGGLASLGQSSAAMQGNAGANMASNVGSIYSAIGAQNAQQAAASGAQRQNFISTLGNIGGLILGRF